jgi:hypothetical protein
MDLIPARAGIPVATASMPTSGPTEPRFNEYLLFFNRFCFNGFGTVAFWGSELIGHNESLWRHYTALWRRMRPSQSLSVFGQLHIDKKITQTKHPCCNWDSNFRSFIPPACDLNLCKVCLVHKHRGIRDEANSIPELDVRLRWVISFILRHL